MTADPFPVAGIRSVLDAAPSSSWVECVSCVEFKSLSDDSDPLEWPDEHAETYPGHDRYRVVRQTNFSVVPTSTARAKSSAVHYWGEELG